MTVQAATKAGNTETDTSLPQFGMVDKQMFLKLLVAQIKNQDPMNPSDGTQFLTQLAQFSELEQTMGIREGVEQLRDALVPSQNGEN